MQLILEVQSVTRAGKRIWLRPGQKAVVGRTERADYVFPSDEYMSSEHFALVWRESEWFIHDMRSSAGTLVNGEAVAEQSLRDADQVIAGQTVFLVQIEGGSRRDVVGVTFAANDELKSAKAAAQTIGPWSLKVIPDRWRITSQGLCRTEAEQFPATVLLGESSLPPGSDLASYVLLQRVCLAASDVVAEIDGPRQVVVPGAEEAWEFVLRMQAISGVELVERQIFARRGTVIASATLITSAEQLEEINRQFDGLMATMEVGNVG